MSRKKRKLNPEVRTIDQNSERDIKEEIIEEPETQEGPELEEDAPAERLGVISEDTRVTGDILTDGHLQIGGIVEGNVYAKGDINVTGKIKGRICCLNMESYGQIETDEIEAKGRVILGEDMSIKGNVICRDAAISGRVYGNLFVSGNLTLSRSAVITGDIKTVAMSAELGAEINGNVSMGN